MAQSGRIRVRFGRVAHQRQEFLAANGFNFDQALGDGVQLVAVIAQHAQRAFVGGRHDDIVDFFVDLFSNAFAVVALLTDLAPQEDQFFFLAEDARPQLGAHAPAGNHGAGDDG